MKPKADKHPYWRVEEVFNHPMKLVYGLTERNFSCGMHVQDFYEINIIVRGKGTHYIGDSEVKAQKGDVFIIPPRVSHGYSGGEGFDVYHLLLSPQYLGKYSADLQMLPSFQTLFAVEPFMRERVGTKLYLKLNDDEFSYLYPYFDSIHRYSENPNISNGIICNSKTLIFITRICMWYERYQENEGGALSESGDFIKSVSYIYGRYYDNISVNDLCDMAKMSRTAYIEKFKSVCGTTPMEFLVRHRISVAEALLSESDISVSEIADRTGFYDASHFIRTFSKYNGITPSAFRRNLRRI